MPLSSEPPSRPFRPGYAKIWAQYTGTARRQNTTTCTMYHSRVVIRFCEKVKLVKNTRGVSCGGPARPLCSDAASSLRYCKKPGTACRTAWSGFGIVSCCKRGESKNESNATTGLLRGDTLRAALLRTRIEVKGLQAEKPPSVFISWMESAKSPEWDGGLLHNLLLP